MVARVGLRISRRELDAVVAHLLPDPMVHEEAGFGFADYRERDGVSEFRLKEWVPVPPEGFESRSLYHLSLSDGFRVRAIRRAHELGCCLVEWHSHAGANEAEFSVSDLFGFEEFVPHVRWRLAGRPYAAVVVADGSFDGFAWIGDGTPCRLAMIIEPSGKVMRGTERSAFDRASLL